jgi:DNA-binding HxlR family transcriptional regulator
VALPQPLPQPERARRRTAVATEPRPGECCPLLHEAVELVGKRWTGAIVQVLLSNRRPMRFTQIGEAVPRLSDRLLSERMKELEARGIVERTERAGPSVRVEYALTPMGRELESALVALESWAQRWLPYDGS